MRYKNKNIRFYYSVAFSIFMVGTVMTCLSLLLIVLGVISTSRNMKNVQHIDTVLQDSGNHAGNVAYFDITQEPISLGKNKKEKYYLVTDGNEYRLASLTDKEYEAAKSAIDASGSFHIQGMTHLITSDKFRDDIAQKAAKYTGQKINVFNMDDILGDVCIEYMKISFVSVFNNSLGMVGFIWGIISVFIFLGGLYEVRSSRKVISLSNITAKEIDEEANKKGSVWLDSLRIYLTENMVLGIISNSNNHEGQVALRYDQIQRIYGYNKVVSPEYPARKGRYIIEAIATDGKKYILSDVGLWAEELMYETGELFRLIKDKNTNIKFEPEDTKYKTFRFSYALLVGEGNKVLNQSIDESVKEEIEEEFSFANPVYYFKPADAVLSMKMSIPEDGICEITTSFFGDTEIEADKYLYDSLEEKFFYAMVIDEDEDDYHISIKEL